MTEATIKVHVRRAPLHRDRRGQRPRQRARQGAAHRDRPLLPAPRARSQLTDFKVRVLDEKKGTGAVTRVLIESADHETSWGTVGVSENIIEASWEALVDSVEYGLSHGRRRAE